MNAMQGGKILIVDDSINNLKLLEGILGEAGYQVRLASDGELALRSAMIQPPSLVLLDIRMPGLDGFEVCRRLKAEERTREVPVIFISILEDEADKVKGFRAGGVDYITKPFQPEEVLARVETHLRLRALTERLEQTVAQRTAELAINERRYRLGQSAARIGTWEYDLTSERFWGSDEAKHIYGFAPDAPDFSGDSVEACIPERSRVRQALADLIDKGAPYDLEFEIRPADGSGAKIISSVAELHRDEQGNPLKIIGVIQDITRRKQAEDEVRRNLIRQQAQLDLYREMAEAAPPEIIAFVVDKCVELTGSAIGFIGLVSDDDRHLEPYVWSATVMASCAIDPPSLLPLTEAGLWAEPIRQGRVIIVNDYAAPNPWKRGCPGGHPTLTRFMGIPVRDKERVVAVAGVANRSQAYAQADEYHLSPLLQGMWDLIKRKRAEEALNRLNDELERRVEERTAELAANNRELERANRLFVGREIRMIELKERIRRLEGALPKGTGA